MAKHRFFAAAQIPASAERVYGIIADYRAGHPHILPKPEFVSLVVDQGGVGSGTIITFQMKLLGSLRTFRAAISEPQPGRVLVETDLDTGTATTFTVDPVDGGSKAQVTITTELAVREGVFGIVESWLAERALKPVYHRELRQLADVAQR